MVSELEKIQVALKLWVAYNKLNEGNFETSYRSLLGLQEELGELSHAHLKQLQGIRGTIKEHEEAARDAIGDLMIYLIDYCNAREFDLWEIVRNTWEQVSKRDWIKFPKNGIDE